MGFLNNNIASVTNRANGEVTLFFHDTKLAGPVVTGKNEQEAWGKWYEAYRLYRIANLFWSHDPESGLVPLDPRSAL